MKRLGRPTLNLNDLIGPSTRKKAAETRVAGARLRGSRSRCPTTARVSAAGSRRRANPAEHVTFLPGVGAIVTFALARSPARTRTYSCGSLLPALSGRATAARGARAQLFADEQLHAPHPQAILAFPDNGTPE